MAEHHPLFSRAHLEALLVGMVLLNPALAVDVDVAHLSPAAAALLRFAADENTTARAALALGAGDEYQARLALRVQRLTLEELCFWPAATLVALVNTLPALGVRRRRAA